MQHYFENWQNDFASQTWKYVPLSMSLVFIIVALSLKFNEDPGNYKLLDFSVILNILY